MLPTRLRNLSPAPTCVIWAEGKIRTRNVTSASTPESIPVADSGAERGHKAAAKPRSTASRTGIAVLTIVPGHCRKGDAEAPCYACTQLSTRRISHMRRAAASADHALFHVPACLAISPCASGGTWHSRPWRSKLFFSELHKNKKKLLAHRLSRAVGVVSVAR